MIYQLDPIDIPSISIIDQVVISVISHSNLPWGSPHENQSPVAVTRQAEVHKARKVVPPPEMAWLMVAEGGEACDFFSKNWWNSGG